MKSQRVGSVGRVEIRLDKKNGILPGGRMPNLQVGEGGVRVETSEGVDVAGRSSQCLPGAVRDDSFSVPQAALRVESP